MTVRSQLGPGIGLFQWTSAFTDGIVRTDSGIRVYQSRCRSRSAGSGTVPNSASIRGFPAEMFSRSQSYVGRWLRSKSFQSVVSWQR